MNTLPICMFPTRVLLIDDNALSSKKLAQDLEDLPFTFHIFDNPQEALTVINESDKPASFQKRLVSQPDDKEWQHVILDVNVYDLMHEVYNPKRFDQISTVVVDFAMPGMNGLEVCEKITDPSIQKILLTGVADETLAIEAFNRGRIHRYLKKEDHNISILLKQYLLEAQQAYFARESQLMFDAVTFNPELSCLRDPVFIRFFQNLRQEKNIIEYYLFEISGNFLLLDGHANAYGLFTHNQSIIDMWNEDCPQIDEVSPQLLHEMRTHQKMICFHHKETFRIPSGLEWEKYAYPLKKLEGGREPYFYACDKDMIDIETHKVISFSEFKKANPIRLMD